MKNSVIVICGKSGAGKSVVLNELVKKNNCEKVITSTTRAPRNGEVDGEDFHFLSDEEFKNKIAKNEFVEHVFNKDNYYGVQRKDLLSKSDKQKVMVVDPVGLSNLMTLLPKMDIEVFSVFINESTKTCLERISQRNEGEGLTKNELGRVSDLRNGREDGFEHFVQYDLKTTPLLSISDVSNEIMLEKNKSMKNNRVAEKKENTTQNNIKNKKMGR